MAASHTDRGVVEEVDVGTDTKKRKPGRPVGTAKPGQTNNATAAAAKVRKERAAERKRLREEAKQAEEAAALVAAKPRWKQLEDGDITLKDLTDEELIRGECANNDGSWEGRRHTHAPRMINRMRTEYKRRFSKGIEMLGPLVLETMEDVLMDDESRAQQVAVIKMVTEYTIGKVPEVVHVGGETEFDRLQQGAFITIARGVEGVDVPALEGDDDIVDAELVEEQ